MILRRVIDHFQKQEWTAIALDFLIVVVGVFVGLQVSNWNDARQARLRETTYLSLLRDDVEGMRRNLNDRYVVGEGLEDAMLRTLRALETCGEENVTRRDIERTFTEYQNVVTIQLLNATYNEMIATGALAALTDAELKRAIVDLYTHLESLILSVPLIRASMTNVDRIVWDNVQLSYGEDRDPILLSFDFQDLCASPTVSNAIVEMIDMRRDWVATTDRVTTNINDVAARLDEKLGEVRDIKEDAP